MVKDTKLIKHTNHLNKLEENGYKFICNKSDFEERIGKRFIVNDVEIAVFKVKDEIFVLNNICPHQQSHIIYDGAIEDEFVVCPAHGWKFNLRTGKKESGSNGLQVYPVEIIDNKIYVKVHTKKTNW